MYMYMQGLYKEHMQVTNLVTGMHTIVHTCTMYLYMYMYVQRLLDPWSKLRDNIQ